MNPESAPQPTPTPEVPQNQNVVVSEESSSKKPLIIIFIIILLLGIGAFYYFMVRQENNPANNIKPTNQVAQPVVTAFSSPTPTVNLDSSDTQLDKDIQAINDKVNNLATDVNNVQSGLNDKTLDNGQ